MFRERDAHLTTAAETNSDQTEAHTGRRYGTRHCYDHRLSLRAKIPRDYVKSDACPGNGLKIGKSYKALAR